jgi:hypothetical protein
MVIALIVGYFRLDLYVASCISGAKPFKSILNLSSKLLFLKVIQSVRGDLNAVGERDSVSTVDLVIIGIFLNFLFSCHLAYFSSLRNTSALRFLRTARSLPLPFFLIFIFIT